jgi:hypothetical protein
MSHQNPLQRRDSAFIAQFSSLEQLTNIDSTLRAWPTEWASCCRRSKKAPEGLSRGLGKRLEGLAG